MSKPTSDFFAHSQRSPAQLLADQFRMERNRQRLQNEWNEGGNYPPYCNTGGYEGGSKNKGLEDATLEESSFLNVTAIDWLRATTNDLEAFKGAMGDIEGILEETDIDTHWQDKGMHGYEQSAALMIWKDNDYLTVGHIGTSEQGRNTGGLFELTGVGCKVLAIESPALWHELYTVLSFHEWRLTRVDIALDLSGEYAKERGLTVPKLFDKATNQDLFKSERQRNPNMKQGFSIAGDWSPLITGGVTPATYDPLQHCPGGLTFYVGNRKSSDDYFRVYEKGKELLGKMAEPESIDRGWIRIEHEMSRKASGRTIPLDVMIRPDHYFCANRPDARQLMQQLRQHRTMEKCSQWQRQQFQREKGLLLSKKIHWAKHSYGRLIRTLRDKGLSADEIVEELSRTAGLKEFVFDLEDSPPDKPIDAMAEGIAA